MYMDEEIKKALSGDEVIKLTGDPRTNLISYADIHKYKTLDQLLGPSRSCIILYEWRENYGHWTAVFEDIHGDIEVFDSYGTYEPDDELNMIPKDFAKLKKENYPYLVNLLVKSGKNVVYNDNKYQSFDNMVATCGRYVGARLFFRFLDLDHFNKIFEYNKKYTPDELITIITENLI